MSKFTLERLIRITNQRILRPLYRDSGGIENTIFLAGVGRSGTTWIQNLINNDGSYRIMFEPFYKLKTSLLDSWREHQYLPADNREPRYVEPAAQILTGKIRSLWVDKFNTKRIVRKRIIKDIRAGLILYWIKTNFPEIPIFLAIRNPFAAIKSQLNANWDVDMAHYLDQSDLMDDFLNPWADEIRSASTPLERNFFRWCIENYVPLCQFQADELLVVTYEDCCTHPDRVNREVCQFLNREYHELSADLISRPSAVTVAGSAIKSGGSLLRPASSMFSPDEIQTGLRILRLFGFDSVYDDSIQLKTPAQEIPVLFNSSNTK